MEYDPNAETNDRSGLSKASLAVLRGVLVPLASFYSRGAGRGAQGEERPTELTEAERLALFDAANKLVVEGETLLRTFRTTGEPNVDKQYVQRNGETGLWPEPSIALVAETLSAVGLLRESADLQQVRQDRELAKLQAQVELKRLELAQQRMAMMQLQVQRGDKVIHDPGESWAYNVYTVEEIKGLQNVSGGQQQVKVLAMTSQAPPPPDDTALAGAEQQQIAEPQTMWDKLCDCVRVALCDLLLCLIDLICVDGKVSFDAFENQQIQQGLRDCFGTFLCTVLRCLPDILCPPEAPACLPAPEPCDFAIEEGH